ncbi:MAG: reprolysin-like metallopeptidase [Phycisphaerales bacterium]
MKKFLMAALAACIGSFASAQQGPVTYWQSIGAEMPAAVKAQEAWIRPFKFNGWRLADAETLKQRLAAAPMEFTPEGDAAPLEFPIPRPDGTFAWFAIVESPVMEPALSAFIPEVRTYRGQGLDDPSATVRLDWTPQGFHASVLTPEGSYYVDPFSKNDTQHYSSYFLSEVRPTSRFVCYTDDIANQSGLNDEGFDGGYGDRVSGNTLRTFQLAMAATGEFTFYHGGTQALAQAAIVTGVNRINQVWENECAIRFTLVGNNQNVVYTDSGTDPYTGTDVSAMLGENQANLNAVIGTANYDIGHVVTGVNLGGVAQLGVVCGNSRARGATGLAAPAGDFFWVSYVSHEIGHQFSATHTFNSNTAPCTANRSAATAYEPGSGVTIMSYANNCSPDSYQGASSPYFHTASYDQIIAHASGRNCDTETATGNTPPTANAGVDRTIPFGTLFTVTGTASDVDGDTLTYCWEQKDAGAAQTLAEMLAADNGSSPIFRNWPANNQLTRTFPRYSDALYNALVAGERYPGAARTLDLRFTVRDNRSAGGGVNADSIVINIRADSGPFLVTYPNVPGLAWTTGQTQTVTWDVANTTATPVSATNVNILLSTDGGYTFPIVLAANTPNDGTQAVTVPDVASAACRVRIEPTNNVFFDISNYNFEIGCDTSPIPSFVQATDGTFCDRVDITWNPSAGATSYAVFRNTINLGSSAVQIGSPASNSFADTTAVPGVTYYYFVRSVNACGSSGVSISNSGFRGASISAPGNVLASDSTSCSAVSVSWDASAGATGYQVWRSATNNSAAATLIGSPASSPFADSSAPAGTTFFYFVVATSPCGSSAFSASNSGSVASAAGQPTGVVATDSDCGSVQVSWAGGGGATGYEVLRGTTASLGAASLIASPSASPFTDASATAGTTYFYWVRATNACGASAAAGPDSGLRPTTPSAPLGLIASDSTACDRVDVSWSPVAGASSYTVVRSTSNNSASGSTVGTPAGASFADTSAAAGTTYFYFVSASNNCGTSGFSTGEQGTRGTTPEAPSAVTASDSSACDRVDLSWASAPGATSYEVFRSATNNSGAAASLGTTTGTSFADSTVPAATEHYYFVKAISPCGTSPFSAPDSGTRGGVPAAPTAAAADRNTVCANDTGTISLTATGALGTTRWFSGSCGGTEIGVGAAVQIDSPTAATTYFARNETDCGQSTCASVVVSVTAAPEAPASISLNRDNLCADDTGTVQLTAVGGTGTTLRWFGGACGGIELGTGNPLVVESPAATTQYFARWESTCGNSNCASAAITIAPTPTVTSVAFAGSGSYLIGDAAQVTVNLSGPASAGGGSVLLTSSAFAPTNVPIAAGSTSGIASVTFTAYGVGLGATATGASCIGGSATSSSFDVIGGPVIYVSVTGNDGNDGTSPATAVRTVEAAVARVAPGGTVMIGAGVFPTHAVIDRTVAIFGDAAATTILDGGSNGRVLDITGAHGLTLRSVAIVNGQTAADGAGVRCAIGSSLTVEESLFANNVATGRGGAIDGQGLLSISGSTFSANTAAFGGAVAIGGTSVSLTNSTLSGNTATGSGGAVWVNCSASATLLHTTIALNSATQGGGLFVCSSGTAQIASTILANNSAAFGPDAHGVLNSLGHNLVASASGLSGLLASDLQGVDPLLAALADNGGPTQTHSLGAGSPAVDAADPACNTTTDQRGVSRPLDGDGDTLARCDIGAFELQPGQCPWQVAGCAADFDNSGGVDGDDVIAFFEGWDASAPCADVDLTGSTDGDDVIVFFTLWDAGGC